MLQDVLPQLRVLCISLLETIEELLRSDSEIARKPQGAAVGFKAPLLPAVARTAVRHNADVPEFGRPSALSVNIDRAPDAVLKKEINEVLVPLLRAEAQPLGRTGARAVIFNKGRIGNRVADILQADVLHFQRR